MANLGAQINRFNLKATGDQKQQTAFSYALLCTGTGVSVLWRFLTTKANSALVILHTVHKEVFFYLTTPVKFFAIINTMLTKENGISTLIKTHKMCLFVARKIGFSML